MKIVVNACYGGYSLSELALFEYCRRKGITDAETITACGYRGENIPRDDPVLVSVVDDLGEAADGNFARLVVKEIDDDHDGFWKITEYDGVEEIVLNQDAVKMHHKTAHILYATDLSDQEKLQRLSAIFPPLPSMLKRAKVDALYEAKGPVETMLGSSWAQTKID